MPFSLTAAVKGSVGSLAEIVAAAKRAVSVRSSVRFFIESTSGKMIDPILIIVKERGTVNRKQKSIFRGENAF